MEHINAVSVLRSGKEVLNRGEKEQKNSSCSDQSNYGQIDPNGEKLESAIPKTDNPDKSSLTP